MEVFRQQLDGRLVGLAVRRRCGGPDSQCAVGGSAYLVSAGTRSHANRDNEVIAASSRRVAKSFYMTANGRNPETIRVSAPIRMMAKIGDRSKPPSVGMMR